jgi:regulatory protein
VAKEADGKSLRALALRALARREHTRLELSRRLAPHGETAEIEALLDDLERLELLSDVRAVESFVAARRGRYGNLRLKRELRERGAADTLIETALARTAEDELPRAHELWQRRFGQPPSGPSDRLRQQRFLMARGFAPDMLKRVLRKYEEDEQT